MCVECGCEVAEQDDEASVVPAEQGEEEEAK